MGSHKNTLLQKLALLGLVSSVGIGAGTHVVGQTSSGPATSGYEAMIEEARTLAGMVGVNPGSPASRQALIRLQTLLAALPPTVRASVIADIVATTSLPPTVVAAFAASLPGVPLASVAPTPTGYF